MPATRVCRGMNEDRVSCFLNFRHWMELYNELHTSVHCGYVVELGCYRLLALVDTGYDCKDVRYELHTLVHMPQN